MRKSLSPGYQFGRQSTPRTHPPVVETVQIKGPRKLNFIPDAYLVGSMLLNVNRGLCEWAMLFSPTIMAFAQEVCSPLKSACTFLN